MNLGLSLAIGGRRGGGAAPPPLDDISGVQAAFGTEQLLTSYSGSYMTESGGLVSAWLDQSGNGYDATQSTDVNKPAYSVDGPIFDGWRASSTDVRSLGIPAGVSVNLRDFSFYAVVETSTLKRANYIIAISGVNFVIMVQDGQVKVANFGARTTSLFVPSNRCVIGVTGTASGCDVYVNTVANKATVTALGASTLSSGSFSSNSASFIGRMSEAVFFSRAISEAEMDGLLQSAVSRKSIVTAPSKKYVVSGDSLSYGIGATLNQNYISRTSTEATAWVYNFGLTGRRADQIASEFATNEANVIDANTTHIVWAGSNDLTPGDSGATIYSEVSSIVSAGVTAGATTSVVFTLSTNNAGAGGTARDDFNDLVVANSIGADEIIDIASDPVLGFTAGNFNDPTKYLDGVHQNDDGYAAIAALLDTALGL